MYFPTYRQQGLLIAQDWPLVDMMCQVLSNEKDRMKGRQLPVMYSAREAGFFSISGNLGTQYIQAVGWAMASAIRGDTQHRGRVDRRGRDGRRRLPRRAGVRLGLPGAGDPERRQQPVGDLDVPGHRRRRAARRSRPARHGYGIPALRVDGNDYLAVYAASAWAAERARSNLGPTLIEWVTYRVGAALDVRRSVAIPAARTIRRRGRSAIRSSG